MEKPVAMPPNIIRAEGTSSRDCTGRCRLFDLYALHTNTLQSPFRLCSQTRYTLYPRTFVPLCYYISGFVNNINCINITCLIYYYRYYFHYAVPLFVCLHFNIQHTFIRIVVFILYFPCILFFFLIRVHPARRRIANRSFPTFIVIVTTVQINHLLHNRR